MENSLSIIISSLLLDAILTVCAKHAFKLKVGKVLLVSLQAICILPTILYVFLPITFFQFVLTKILMWFVFTLLVTDSYLVKDIFGIWFGQILLMFSVYGFAEFLVLFVKASVVTIFGIKLKSMFDFVIILGLLLYFAAVYIFVQFFSKTKNLKNILAKVSFLICGKHIEITGLLDSGNSLYDTKTGKAVVVVSVSAFKKILPKDTYQNLLCGDYSFFKIVRFVDYKTVDGKTAKMPVVDVGSVCVKFNLKVKNFSCVIGIVQAEFDTEKKVECLLHSDLL